MAVKAKSLRLGGIEIKAENATYETYIHHLCRCSECGAEVCLAKGQIIKPHWKHFPGQGQNCPDKSVKRINVEKFNSISHEQCRAFFKTRFLEILDIAWNDNGCLKNREASKNLWDIKIPVPGNVSQRKSYMKYTDIFIEVNKLRRNLTASKKVLASCLDQAFNGDVAKRDIEDTGTDKWNYEEIILTTNYEKHKRICHEALEYLFGNGRQDILKEVLAKIVIMYLYSGTEILAKPDVLQAFRTNDPHWELMNHKDFPLWCLVGIVANLINVPWERITSDLNQGIVSEIRKSKSQWLFPSSTLLNTREAFGLVRKSTKSSAQGFGK